MKLFAIIKHIVEMHRQNLTNEDYFKQELTFAGTAREKIRYKSLREKDRGVIDYFDRHFRR